MLLLLAVFAFLLLRYFYIRNKEKKMKSKMLDTWAKCKEEEYYNFHAISRYFENNESNKEVFHIISDESEVDLDLNELFKFIDRTSSKIGQQYLYFKLRTVGNIQDLLKFDSLSKLFKENESIRLKCQLYLSKLNRSESYDLEELINGVKIEKPKTIWIVYLLTITSITLIILGFINSFYFLLLLPILIINFYFHFQNKKNVYYYASGVNQLSKGLKVAKKIAKLPEVKAHFKDFKFISKINAIKFRTKFIGIEKKLDNEFAFVIAFALDLFKILFNLEYILFFSFIDSIAKQKKSIEELYVFIGEVDSAISVASLKSGDVRHCTPEFLDEKRFFVKDLVHPLVENCVSNHIDLLNKSMLLTGSNMSGKSTFIRAVAINSLLAQTLNICFAKEYRAPFLKLYSSIRMSDDLKEDKSYYLTEVLRIKELVDVSAQDVPKLFVLDEIFKGTNTIERISGAKGILSYLNKKNNIVFVSTHDIELTELVENYELFHFSESIKDDELHFDHEIKPGMLKTRNAIRILELYNYPEEIVMDSKNTERDYFN